MTAFQPIFDAAPQSTLDMGEPQQNGLQFPATLAERHHPRRIADFIGLSGPKKVMTSLSQNPRSCAMLFIGPPGTGKTEMGLAFAAQLPGSLRHVSAQKCDVGTLERLNESFTYYPPVGKYWVCVVDEADEMTPKAQVNLLSRIDGTNALKPIWGGGFERGTPPPVIWIFTCNGIGPEQTGIPHSLLARFTSRCLQQEFAAPSVEEITKHLKAVCRSEGHSSQKLNLDGIAQLVNGNVRDAMMKLDLALMGADLPKKPVPAKMLAEESKVCPVCGVNPIPRRYRLCDPCVAKRKVAKLHQGESE